MRKDISDRLGLGHGKEFLIYDTNTTAFCMIDQFTQHYQ